MRPSLEAMPHPLPLPLRADNLDLSYCNSPLLSPAPTAAGSLSLSSLHPSLPREQ